MIYFELKDYKTDYKTNQEIISRTKSKFLTKIGCKLCNLKKNKIDKSDKT